MLNYIIVEDDPLSAEILADLILDIRPQSHLIASCQSVAEAIDTLSKAQPDLVLLDMQLPDGLGFDILSQLPEIVFEIIIITSHDSFMLDAIRHAAVDYLTKPVDKNKMLEALERFEKRREKSLRGVQAGTSIDGDRGKVALPSHDGIILVAFQDVLCLESEGSYTRFTRTKGADVVTSRNLGTYEMKFARHGFFRVHHRFMINLHHVRKYMHEEGGYVLMINGARIKVARRRRAEFLELLSESDKA